MRFDGIEESLLLFPLGAKRAEVQDNQQYLDGRLAWVLVSLESDKELQPAVQKLERWSAGLEPRDLAKREIAELEKWRVKAPAVLTGGNERRLWRQSEVILRIAQSREPNHPGRYK